MVLMQSMYAERLETLAQVSHERCPVIAAIAAWYGSHAFPFKQYRAENQTFAKYR